MTFPHVIFSNEICHFGICYALYISIFITIFAFIVLIYHGNKWLSSDPFRLTAAFIRFSQHSDPTNRVNHATISPSFHSFPLTIVFRLIFLFLKFLLATKKNNINFKSIHFIHKHKLTNIECIQIVLNKIKLWLLS